MLRNGVTKGCAKMTFRISQKAAIIDVACFSKWLLETLVSSNEHLAPYHFVSRSGCSHVTYPLCLLYSCRHSFLDDQNKKSREKNPGGSVTSRVTHT